VDGNNTARQQAFLKLEHRYRLLHSDYDKTKSPTSASFLCIFICQTFASVHRFNLLGQTRIQH
jgi:hypothetical protein